MKHNSNIQEENDNFYFEKWLIGLTDGDGTFSVIRQNKK
jgi:hypothetical protein